MTAGLQGTFALDNDGRVWGWGYNEDGEVGIPGPKTVTVPTPIPDLPPVAALSAAGHNALALDLNGTLWCWGRQYSTGCGQADDSGAFAVRRPVPVPIPAPVLHAELHGNAAFAFTADAVWVWGSDVITHYADQSAVTTTLSYSRVVAPARLAGFTGAVSFAASTSTIFAIAG